MFDADCLDARDPALIASLLPTVRSCVRRYLRLESEGFHDLPEGPVLYVGNHNGGMAGPDVACTLSELWNARGPEAPLYALAHDFAMRQLQAFGRFVQRFGALRATPDNALRALASGAQVLVYPGGELDAYRHSRRRDEVVFGARTGFVRVAQRARVPIVPIVAHGAHRSAYIFSEGERLVRWLRLKQLLRNDRFPLALAFPWGLAAGPWVPYFPLPFKVRLRALPPITVDPNEDPALVREHVRSEMQRALDALSAVSRRASAR